MLTTAVKGIAALRWVGGTPGNLDEVSWVYVEVQKIWGRTANQALYHV